MSKTVSARISINLHEELRDRCNNLGCTINEFVAAAIEFAMNGSVEFEFDPDLENEREKKEPHSELSESKPKVEDKAYVVRLHG